MTHAHTQTENLSPPDSRVQDAVCRMAVDPHATPHHTDHAGHEYHFCSAGHHAIAAMPGVGGVHDLHVWSMTADDVSLTVHVEVADSGEGEAIRASLKGMLAKRFKIEHVTIQTETEGCTDDDRLHR